MNRPAFPTESILATTKSTSKFSSLHTVFDVAKFLARGPAHETELPCTTFAPVRYEPGYAYPLIVWLHGPEGNERQLRQVMPLINDQNYVGVAPRGTCRDRQAFDWRQTNDHIAEAESRVYTAIDVARQRFNIHSDRVFLVGHASGGTMALRIAWNNPRQFGGVATIGGSIPSTLCPLRYVNELRSLPCMLASARHSCTYPEHQVCRDLRLLHSAGCRVELRQYVWGEDLTTPMFDDLNRWLMSLVCPPSS